MQDNNSRLETLVLGNSPVTKSAATPVSALAFTCTRDRPFFVRCCILQMQQQSYPVDHVVYINHPDAESKTEHYNYISLLHDLAPQRGSLTICYGRSGTQQFNFMQALTLAKQDDYELFLKIDDDDIYRRHYVRNVVSDFLKNDWDFSGTHSQGLIDGPKWGPQNRVNQLGMEPEDIRLGVPEMMANSYVLSRKAVNLIKKIPADIDCNEDILWRRKLIADKTINTHIRQHSGMSYHLHGKNISTWNSFGKIL